MSEVAPQPAATLALVRDAPQGLEVLLLQRSFRSGFMPGVHVFPGGVLDEADRSPQLYALCAGLDDAAASRRLGIERGGLAYWIAAIREAFEEAGVLLAYGPHGGFVEPSGPARRRFLACRRAEPGAHPGFSALLAAERLRLATDRLVYFSHWITPLRAPRRYDTRFFFAELPPGERAAPDGRETVAHAWLRPAEALARCARGRIRLRTPTLKTLELFAGFATSEELAAALRARCEIPAILPRIARDGRTLLPGEPGYEEAGSAEGRGRWKL